MTPGAGNKSRVDVFIPCYNYGRYLPACVASALQPDGPPVRILIIDDASTDDTPAIAARLVADHPNLTYVRHARNLGHIGTYNQGVRWARSEFFQFLSADDLIAPGALRRAVSFFEAHPDVGMVYGRTRTFQDQPPVMPPAGMFKTTLLGGLEFLRRAAAAGDNPIANPSAVMVRTALQHAIGGYLHALPHSGDMEMWLRFAVHAPVGFLDIEQGLYRRHQDNMSLGYGNVNDCLQRLAAWESICTRYRDRLPDDGRLMQIARRAMARDVFWKAVAAFDRDVAMDIDEHLRLAVSFDPQMRHRSAWWRFRVKRLVGRAMAGRAAALRTSFREIRSRTPVGAAILQRRGQ